jgi:hypothetical protein
MVAMRLSPLVLVALGVLAGCAATQSRGADNRAPDVAIYFERGPCLFNCPEYTITIAPDRTVTYEGKAHAAVRGKRSFTIGAEAYQAIVDAVRRANVAALGDRYEGGPTDAPSVVLRVTSGGRTKEIYHYLGSLDAPKGLTDLEETIDANALPSGP